MKSAASVKRVLVTAGGTGGHVFPALAAAKMFQQQGVEVRWIGTRQGIEANLIPANGIEIDYLDVSGVRGQGIKRLLAAPLKIAKSVWDVMSIVRRFKPDLVLGMGGFVTGPVGLGVWLSGKPVFIHEQNAIAGFTNKLLAKIACTVFQAFPGAFPESEKVETTGNPVRKEIIELPEPALRYSKRQGDLNLLVLGGSQGAVALNQMIPGALAKLKGKVKFNIIHQAGDKNREVAAEIYQKANVCAEVVPFITDMASAYASADLVICRSGALTVSELAAAGVASLLVPYPHAVDDHQTKNAEYLSQAGAAILFQQKVLTQDILAEVIINQLSDRKCLSEMAIAARKLAMTQATEKVVQRCMEVARDK